MCQQAPSGYKEKEVERLMEGGKSRLQASGRLPAIVGVMV
jgi:hypothetical protein